MDEWHTESPHNKEGRYLVTLKRSYGRIVRQANRHEYPKGNWHWVLYPFEMYGDIADKDVIAWQKQPDPYMGD